MSPSGPCEDARHLLGRAGKKLPHRQAINSLFQEKKVNVAVNHLSLAHPQKWFLPGILPVLYTPCERLPCAVVP